MTVQRLLERLHDPDYFFAREVGAPAKEIALKLLHTPIERLMLMNCAGHQIRSARRFVHIGEKLRLFIVMVLQDAINPGYAIADKGGFFTWLLYARRLLVDAVVAADEGVVAEGHVGRFDGEGVILETLMLVTCGWSVVRSLQVELTLPVSNLGVGSSASGVSV